MFNLKNRNHLCLSQLEFADEIVGNAVILVFPGFGGGGKVDVCHAILKPKKGNPFP